MRFFVFFSPQVHHFAFAGATQSQQSYRLPAATTITDSSHGVSNKLIQHRVPAPQIRQGKVGQGLL